MIKFIVTFKELAPNQVQAEDRIKTSKNFTKAEMKFAGIIQALFVQYINKIQKEQAKDGTTRA